MPNITVLALGEHVDYWDRLGWRDPFSSPLFTRRQGEYQAQAFRTSSIYTPQVVVDGQWEGVGSDEARMRQAIRQAALKPHALVRLGIDWPAGSRDLRVSAGAEVPAAFALDECADLILAVTEDRLTSHVAAGENHGRTLTHSAVVRTLRTAASVTARDRTVSTTLTLDASPGWSRAALRVVAFLQERDSRRVIGAAAATF